MNPKPLVALYATCLVNTFRPQVGLAAIELLEQAGCRVEVPELQTCCGQVSYNSGDTEAARGAARQVIDTLAPYAHVVLPSASCAGMMIHHYPRLFHDDLQWLSRARELAGRCHELLGLLDRLQAQPRPGWSAGAVAWHDGCAGLREMHLQDPPRRLLARSGIEVREMAESETCCGFGGTFCAKFPEISARLADDKLDHACATGAHTLLGGDLGCLLHLAGRARRRGLDITVRHVAEALAGEPLEPPIAYPGDPSA